MRVPGSVSRLLRGYQRWAGGTPAGTLCARPRPRARVLSLPGTCWVIPSFPHPRPSVHPPAETQLTSPGRIRPSPLPLIQVGSEFWNQAPLNMNLGYSTVVGIITNLTLSEP